MTFSRENPSPRFRELVACYQQLHAQGDANSSISAEDTFDGHSIIPHITTIRTLVQRFGSKTLLDYGAGKGRMYDREFDLPDGSKMKGLKAVWGLDSVTLYDPGYEEYAALPSGTFDAVICTDVLEHITEEDIDWVIDELFGYARHFVYGAIACYPAQKILPNGMNAHVTQKSPEWWSEKFRARRAATGAKAEYALVIARTSKDSSPAVVLSFR